MKRFAIIGLGRFGMRLATLLAESGAQVIAIDQRRELVEQIRDQVDRAVCLDATDEQALRSQGIDQVDVAVVGIGSAFEANTLTTVILKQIGVPRVISRATTAVRARILARIGADDTVNPEQESADRWSRQLLVPSIREHVTLAEGFSVAQVVAPESFFEKTLAELRVATKHHVNVIAIRRPVETEADRETPGTEQVVISAPVGDTQIKRGDILLVIGSDQAIGEFGTAHA